MGNSLCHFELMTSDVEKCKAFYGSVFDWQFDGDTMPGYTLVQTGQDPPGGLFPKPETVPSACMNIYFTVDDIETTLKSATDNGGEVLVPKTAIPGVGHFAMFTDPEGIAVGIMQPDE
ncbi:MAG: VOC family protein [Planctomycetes bacterium]|nr:VOC family protein [Planctomycetota bacterium]